MPLFEKAFGREQLTPQDVDFSKIKRILVIRQHDMLGDFLLATPVLRAMRQRFPHAHLGVVARKYFADTLRHHPFVDEVLIFYEQGKEWTPAKLRAFWRRLRSGWDLVVVLNTVSHSFTSDLLAHFSGALYVVGPAQFIFPGCTRNFFYNLISPCDAREKHQSERNLDIVRYIGVDTQDLSEAMRMIDAERNIAGKRLQGLGLRPEAPVVGIHVGAGKIMNRWPADRFAAVAQRLREKYGAQIILFWGTREADLAEQFCAHLRFEPIKVPPASVRELAAYFTHCDLLLCNDTGVMHIGAAVGAPLLAIFGPTDPKEWKPIGKNFMAARGENEKIDDVTVDQAYAAVVSAFGVKLRSRGLSVAAETK